MITGVRYAAPAVYVQLTQRWPSKFARRLSLCLQHTALRRSSDYYPRASQQPLTELFSLLNASLTRICDIKRKSFRKTNLKPRSASAGWRPRAAAVRRKKEHYIFWEPGHKTVPARHSPPLSPRSRHSLLGNIQCAHRQRAYPLGRNSIRVRTRLQSGAECRVPGLG